MSYLTVIFSKQSLTEVFVTSQSYHAFPELAVRQSYFHFPDFGAFNDGECP